MTIETTQTVPLALWEDGTIRVKNTRLLIDMIVNAHNRGECPEEIFDAFPSEVYTVADIYAVIAYYLAHKIEIYKHLADREREAEAVWKKIEALPNYRANKVKLKQALLNRCQEKQK